MKKIYFQYTQFIKITKTVITFSHYTKPRTKIQYKINQIFCYTQIGYLFSKSLEFFI